MDLRDTRGFLEAQERRGVQALKELPVLKELLDPRGLKDPLDPREWMDNRVSWGSKAQREL
jgi:hypothetical protein